jgi:hypothetical protein
LHIPHTLAHVSEAIRGHAGPLGNLCRQVIDIESGQFEAGDRERLRVKERRDLLGGRGRIDGGHGEIR